MKKYLLILMILSSVVTFKQANAQMSEVNETVLGFYEASKNGNVEKILDFIDGPFYEKRKTLLEKNNLYPDFLRKHYKGTDIQIVNADIGNDQIVKKDHPQIYKRYNNKVITQQNYNIMSSENNLAVVIIRHHISDGSSYESKVLLNEDEGGFWKIIDEIRSNGR